MASCFLVCWIIFDFVLGFVFEKLLIWIAWGLRCCYLLPERVLFASAWNLGMLPFGSHHKPSPVVRGPGLLRWGDSRVWDRDSYAQGLCTSSSPCLIWGFIPNLEWVLSFEVSLPFPPWGCWNCRSSLHLLLVSLQMPSGQKELWVPGSPPVLPCPQFGAQTLKLPHLLVCSFVPFRREVCLSVFCIGLDYRAGSHLKGKSRRSLLKAQLLETSFVIINSFKAALHPGGKY